MIRSRSFFKKRDPAQAKPLGDSPATHSLKKVLKSQAPDVAVPADKPSAQRVHFEVKPSAPSSVGVNAVAAGGMKAMLKVRQEHLSKRYSAEDEQQVSALITSLRLGDSRDIATYAANISKHLEPLLSHRRIFYRMMLLHYASILRDYHRMLENPADGKMHQGGALALIKQTRTCVKRDMHLMRKDRELAIHVLDCFAPMAMAVKPGILSGVKGKSDLVNLTEYLIASEPKLETDKHGDAKFYVSKRALAEISENIAREARSMTFSINHPAIVLTPREKEVMEVRELADLIKDTLEQRDVELGPEFDESYREKWDANKVTLETNALSISNAGLKPSVQREMSYLSYAENFKISEGAEVAYANAYLYRSVFKPFTVAAAEDAAAGIEIGTRSELLTGHGLVSLVADETHNFINKHLKTYQLLIQRVLTLSTLSAEHALGEVNKLVQDLEAGGKVR